jgi:hypothetical protein
MGSDVGATGGAPAPSPSSPARGHLAQGRGVMDEHWCAPVSGARRRSGWAWARQPGAESSAPHRRAEVLPPVAPKRPRRAPRAPHRPRAKLWGRPGGTPAGGGPAPESRPPAPVRACAAADASPRASPAGGHRSRSGPALSVGVGSHRAPLPSAPASAVRVCGSPSEATTRREVGRHAGDGTGGLRAGSVRMASPMCRIVVSASIR